MCAQLVQIAANRDFKRVSSEYRQYLPKKHRDDSFEFAVQFCRLTNLNISSPRFQKVRIGVNEGIIDMLGINDPRYLRNALNSALEQLSAKASPAQPSATRAKGGRGAGGRGAGLDGNIIPVLGHIFK